MGVGGVSSLENRVRSLLRLVGLAKQRTELLKFVAEGVEGLYKENGFIDPHRIDFYNMDFFRSKEGNIDLGVGAGAERHTYLTLDSHLVLVRKCAVADTDAAALRKVQDGSSDLVWCDVHFVPDNAGYVMEARSIPESVYDWENRKKSAAPVMLMLQVLEDSLRTREENIESAMKYIGWLR